MKNTFKLIVIGIILFINYLPIIAQETTKITYTLDSLNKIKNIPLNVGDYNITFIGNLKNGEEFETLIKSAISVVNPINIESNSIIPKAIEVNFTVKERSSIEVTINKKKESKVIETYIYTFNSIITHKWHTTLGIAGIALLKTDTYKTSAFEDGYKITQDGSQNLVDPVIVMMFTYIDLEDSNSFGPTGGIGFDLEKISIYGGYSWYFGHNLVLTGGIALHQQLRLDNKYDVGQIVDSPINSDDLNSFYYRVNPFLSLTFALDKNIFKK